MVEEQYESGFESGYIEQKESGETYSLSDVNSNAIAVKDIVDKEAVELVNAIAISNDEQEIAMYLEKFNRNMSKKNLFRILKFNDLLDKVSEEALDRIENHPDELTHSEIVNYIKVSQDAINNAKNASSTDTVTPITLNQQNNTVNVNVNNGSSMDRRSKERIMEAVKNLLNLSLDSDAIDVSSEDKKENNQ